jgi:hypothetical protein
MGTHSDRDNQSAHNDNKAVVRLYNYSTSELPSPVHITMEVLLLDISTTRAYMNLCL